jgi:PEP-CTERM motif
MNGSKTRFIVVAATAGTIAMLSAAVAQASVICAFSCKTASSVPEPATLGLLALGLAGAAIARRRK